MIRMFFAAVAASVVLTGCGPSSDDEVATDPTPTEPAPEPTVGTYPDFEPEDYSYTLVVSCFCPDAGTPVRVTVVDGEAVEAVYAQGGRGVTKGDPAPDYRRLTIDDVIEAANDTEAAVVDVTWPEGQDYPTSVAVDQDELMVDEEVGYSLSDVVVG